MHLRTDYSKYLYHWIKPAEYCNTTEEAYEKAYEIMEAIFEDGYLRASGLDTFKKIKSVCFTESPAEIMKHQESRYQPFGFCFLKEDIFDLGGRHVIYQTKEESKLLDESIHWRHVTYNPQDIDSRKPNGVNFTWEREWRLNEPKLSIFDCYSVIVPNEDWLERLRADIEHWKAYPDYMQEKANIHVDPGPYRRYTPEFIECFDTLYK